MKDYNDFLMYEIANNFWCRHSTGKLMDEIVTKFIVRKTQRKYKKFLELNNHIENKK